MFGKFILIFLVWIGLTNSLDYQELLIGFIVSAIVVYFFTGDEKVNLMKEVKKYIQFTPLFIVNLIKANIELAKIILNPKLPIDPTIVKLELAFDNDMDKLLLANAITLTPGTITLDIKDDDIYIHILDVKNTTKEILEEEILAYKKLIL